MFRVTSYIAFYEQKDNRMFNDDHAFYEYGFEYVMRPGGNSHARDNTYYTSYNFASLTQKPS